MRSGNLTGLRVGYVLGYAADAVSLALLNNPFSDGSGGFEGYIASDCSNPEQCLEELYQEEVDLIFMLDNLFDDRAHLRGWRTQYYREPFGYNVFSWVRTLLC